MRPRSLTIEGLQSFKESQTIDFDRLGETGLFGIFGPTGSGKSTVLDAITLALYGNVLRAARGTQGIINTACDTARVSFTFDLAKGAVRSTYRVDRLYRRKKDSDSAAEIRAARLFDITEGGESVIADKPSEVTGRVEELIGLEMDDFVRSVVLPQNRFQEFLLMDKAKKREMLERIFYLEEYGRQLTEKLSCKLTEARLFLTALKGEMAGLGDISEKSLVEAEKNLVETKKAKEAADKELKILEQKHWEAKEVWQLSGELEAANSGLKELLARSVEIDSQKQLLSRSVKAGELSGLIQLRKNIKKSFETACHELNEVTSRMTEADAKLLEAKDVYTSRHTLLEKERPVLTDRILKLQNALSMKKELEAADVKLEELRKEYRKLREEINELDEELAKLKINSEGLEKALSAVNGELSQNSVEPAFRLQLQDAMNQAVMAENAQKQMNQREKEASAYRSRLAQLESEYSAVCGDYTKLQVAAQQAKNAIELHNEEKPATNEAILAESGQFHAAKLAVEAYLTLLAGRRILTGRQEEAERELSEKRKEISMLQGMLENAASEVNASRLEAASVQAELDKDVSARLAGYLKEGSPCPVCGSLSHPSPACFNEAKGDAGKDPGEAKEKLAAAEFGLKESENKVLIASEQAKGLEKQLLEVNSDIGTKDCEINEVLKNFPNELKSAATSELAGRLSEMKNKLEDRQKASENWDKKLQEVTNTYNKSIELLSSADSIKKAKEAELKIAGENLLSAEKSLQEALNEYRLLKDDLDRQLASAGIEELSREVQKLKDKDKKLEELQKELASLLKQGAEESAKREKLSAERQKLAECYSKAYEEGSALKRQRDEMERKISELAGDEEIENNITNLGEKLKGLEKADGEAMDRVREHDAVLNEALGKKSALEKQSAEYSTSLKDTEDKLSHGLAERGFNTAAAAEECMLDAAKKLELERNVAEYDQKLYNLKGRIEMSEKKLNGRSITEEEWLGLSEKLEAKKQEKDEAAAEHGKAFQTLNNVKNTFERWLTLESKRRNASRKTELLEQLQKLLKGNGFIEFISEERLRCIAHEASVTLGSLTRYRYALELDPENGFVIRDDVNGGVRRLATSLSGGETFLTSLALALALSEQIQLKGQSPLEFFFLDEGFGTLDNSLLDNVMDSLERISSNKRVIGIISHVPELRSRIARRLVIDPASSDGRGSRACVEKA